METDYILETQGLLKELRGFVAVRDVHLHIRRGIVRSW